MVIASQMTAADLAAIERTYGIRLQLPAVDRARVDQEHDQPRQLWLPAEGIR